jgi:hypothetical protein
MGDPTDGTIEDKEQHMSNTPEDPRLLATDQPDLFFEDNTVGRCKKEVWDASDTEIDQILADYGIPSPCEWGKAGSYIQTTVRHQVEAERRNNDIVFIPIGCTDAICRARRIRCTSARSSRACGASQPSGEHR